MHIKYLLRPIFIVVSRCRELVEFSLIISLDNIFPLHGKKNCWYFFFERKSRKILCSVAIRQSKDQNNHVDNVGRKMGVKEEKYKLKHSFARTLIHAQANCDS